MMGWPEVPGSCAQLLHVIHMEVKKKAAKIIEVNGGRCTQTESPFVPAEMDKKKKMT